MADIKFYPYGIGANTVPFQITAVTSEATGHEKIYMSDLIKSTYWQATSSATQNIDIDLGAGYEDYEIDHVLIYVDSGGDMTWYVYADTQSNYSTQTEMFSLSPQGYSGFRLLVATFASVNEFRYWRIRLTNLSTAPKIGLIFIGESKTIATRFSYGGIQGQYDYSGVYVNESLGGNRAGYMIAQPRKRWNYRYEYIDETDKKKFEDIFELTYGSLNPIYFSDENGAYHFVRIMSPTLRVEEITYQLYNIDELILEEEL